MNRLTASSTFGIHVVSAQGFDKTVSINGSITKDDTVVSIDDALCSDTNVSARPNEYVVVYKAVSQASIHVARHSRANHSVIFTAPGFTVVSNCSTA